MARETCFCGRVGDLEDREPVYAGAGEWALSCPMCGHVDRLEAWSEAARGWALAEATRRHESPVDSTFGHVESTSDGRHYSGPPQAAVRSLPRPPLPRDDF